MGRRSARKRNPYAGKMRYWKFPLPNGKYVFGITMADGTPEDLTVMKAWRKHIASGGTLPLEEFLMRFGEGPGILRATDPALPELLRFLQREEREN